MMQSARKLIFVDECDREYKRLQKDETQFRSVEHSSRVRECVAALHRYLNLRIKFQWNRPGKSTQSPLRHHRRRRRHHHHHRGLPYDRLCRRFRDAADVAESSVERGLLFDMETAYSDLRYAGSFGGLNNLRSYSGATTCSAREFLAKRDSYTLHKQRRLRFPRRKTYSKGIADWWTCPVFHRTTTDRDTC